MKKYVYRKFVTDDVFVPFPVSPYVLNLRQSPPKKMPFFAFSRKATMVSVLLTFFISSMGMASAHMGTTVAYFYDEDTSKDNAFRAGSLGFSVQAEGTGYTFESGDEDAAFEVSVITPENDSLSAHYSARAEKTGGSDVFCNALHALATTSPFLYDGALMALDMEPPQPGTWQMDITLASEAGLVHGDECAIDLVYKAWLDGAGPSGGYTEEKRVPLVFTFEQLVSASIAPLSAESVEEVVVEPESDTPAPDVEQSETEEEPPVDDMPPEAVEREQQADEAETPVEEEPEQSSEEDAPAVEETEVETTQS